MKKTGLFKPNSDISCQQEENAVTTLSDALAAYRICARAERGRNFFLNKDALADAELVQNYVQDLKEVLSNNPLAERKAFIRSFVKRNRSNGGRSTSKIYNTPIA